MTPEEELAEVMRKTGLRELDASLYLDIVTGGEGDNTDQYGYAVRTTADDVLDAPPFEEEGEKASDHWRMQPRDPGGEGGGQWVRQLAEGAGEFMRGEEMPGGQLLIPGAPRPPLRLTKTNVNEASIESAEGQGAMHRLIRESGNVGSSSADTNAKRRVMKRVGQRLRADPTVRAGFQALGIRVTEPDSHIVTHMNHMEGLLVLAQRDSGYGQGPLTSSDESLRAKMPSFIEAVRRNGVPSLVEEPDRRQKILDTWDELQDVRQNTEAYSLASRLTNTWAQSSLDNHIVALAIQRAAADEFGLDLPAHVVSTRAERPSFWEGEWSPETQEKLLESSVVKEAARRYVRAVYSETQAELEKAGIVNVLLYRGMDFEASRNPFGDGEGIYASQLQPLSSFSNDYQTAVGFTGRSEDAILLGTVVPRDRIFSYPGTGPGCLGEWEVVVIGGLDDDDVYALPVSYEYDEEAYYEAVDEAKQELIRENLPEPDETDFPPEDFLEAAEDVVDRDDYDTEAYYEEQLESEARVLAEEALDRAHEQWEMDVQNYEENLYEDELVDLSEFQKSSAPDNEEDFLVGMQREAESYEEVIREEEEEEGKDWRTQPRDPGGEGGGRWVRGGAGLRGRALPEFSVDSHENRRLIQEAVQPPDTPPKALGEFTPEQWAKYHHDPAEEWKLTVMEHVGARLRADYEKGDWKEIPGVDDTSPFTTGRDTFDDELLYGLHQGAEWSPDPFEETAAQMVSYWAGTSADSDPQSLAVQRAARDEFGTPWPGFYDEALAKKDREEAWFRMERSEAEAAGYSKAEDVALDTDPYAIHQREMREWEMNRPVFRDFVRAQYAETQAKLDELGVPSGGMVRLYRGMHGEGEGLGLPYGAHVVKADMQPLSSWSLDPIVAGRFAQTAPKNDHALLFTEVPRERIFSFWATGNGCLNEKEVVIIGGSGDEVVSWAWNPERVGGGPVTKVGFGAETLWQLEEELAGKLESADPDDRAPH